MLPFDSSSTSVEIFNSSKYSTVTNGLSCQDWYWGNSTKNDIAEAMEGEKDGTFVVRDASSSNCFTLTLRIGGVNYLMRIFVSNEKCGFTTETLEFDSIVELVDFYRTNSLKEFNEKLNASLLHPLRKINKAEKLHLNLFLQRHRLEAFCADYERTSKRYDQIFLQRTAFVEEKERKSSKISAFSDALTVFNSSLSMLTETIKLPTNTFSLNDRKLIVMNINLQERRIEEILRVKSKLSISLNSIDKQIEEIDKELVELKPRLLDLHRKRNECVDELLDSKIQVRTQIDTIFNSVSTTLEVELDQIRNFLLQASDIWPVEFWLTDDSNKDNALKSIRKKLEKYEGSSDGIFLIRTSQSRPGYFALEVTKDSTIHSCLIEKGIFISSTNYLKIKSQSRDFSNQTDYYHSTKEREAGYAFSNTNMFFSTLVDFVRYYSQVSLSEHNFKLDTKLNVPAFFPY